MGALLIIRVNYRTDASHRAVLLVCQWSAIGIRVVKIRFPFIRLAPRIAWGESLPIRALGFRRRLGRAIGILAPGTRWLNDAYGGTQSRIRFDQWKRG